VLSFDSLMGSTGGAIIQPALGRVADVYGYAPSFLVAAGVHALSLPFIALARHERAPSDPITAEPVEAVEPRVEPARLEDCGPQRGRAGASRPVRGRR
jgi:hypothetical protein